MIPPAMSDESVRAALLAYTDAFPSGRPAFPMAETTVPKRLIEAVSEGPITEETYLFDTKYETIFGENYGSSIGANVDLTREGLIISLETPHTDYLPSDSLFNDSCPFPKLYTD